jgi:hypothetical protein
MGAKVTATFGACKPPMMRTLPNLAALALFLSACGAADPVEVDREPTPAPLRSVPDDALVGRYSGTLPCADCPGIVTTLWLHPDAGFVLQETYLDRDPAPTGTFGSWTNVSGGVELDVLRGGGRPMRWLRTGNGLQLDLPDADARHALERLDATATEELPAMRVAGHYREEAGSHSFQPCGTDRVFPLAVGEWLLALEDARKASGAGEGPVRVRLEVSMGPGQAMEGDQPDTYLWMRGAPQLLKGEVCP